MDDFLIVLIVVTTFFVSFVLLGWIGNYDEKQLRALHRTNKELEMRLSTLQKRFSDLYEKN